MCRVCRHDCRRHRDTARHWWVAAKAARKIPCQPTHEERHVPLGGLEQAAKAPGVIVVFFTPPAISSTVLRPGCTVCMKMSQQKRRRWRPRHTVGMPRKIMVTKPGREGKAISMGTTISIEGRRKQLPGEVLISPLHLFSLIFKQFAVQDVNPEYNSYLQRTPKRSRCSSPVMRAWRSWGRAST